MERITITGVPEHFNLPWRRLVASQPFLDQELELVWVDEPRGSGAMNQAVREGSTELAVILTESFVKDRIAGNTGRMIGYHVVSPLTWGIHVSAKAPLRPLSELKNVPFLVSRMGSGSHLMAYLLAKREGWRMEELEFQVVGDLSGARREFKSSLTKLFLWERYTTQPLVSAGECRRIGEIPTPWPCFAIVASEQARMNHPNVLRQLTETLYAENRRLMVEVDASISDLQQGYGIRLEDVRDWFAQTKWAEGPQVAADSLVNTMRTLLELGLINQTVPVEMLVDQRFVTLT
jgi:ABC-type nitrate/sulfonate/bicarbonate transport system substrate-binding protein